jgi:predicted GIY-YIG superfamily endonuclease
MPKTKTNQYIYIVQASLEQGKCKIGITDDLDRRLEQYNSITGKSKDNMYQYIYLHLRSQEYARS